MVAKAFMAETVAAKQRGELIPRKTVFDTLAHYMVVFRQRALLLHRTITQRLVTLNLIDDANSHAVSEVIDQEIRSLLSELGHLPQKATDPNWMAQLEKDELGLESDKRRPTPSDHQQQQARAKVQREKKTATMRKLRAEGRAA